MRIEKKIYKIITIIVILNRYKCDTKEQFLTTSATLSSKWKKTDKGFYVYFTSTWLGGTFEKQTRQAR